MKSIENLKLSVNKKLEIALTDIDQMKTLILYNQFFIPQFSKYNIENQFLVDQVKVFKYRLLIGFLFADICCSLNLYFNAKAKYEEKFGIRNLLVIINEGFKKIYNFEKINQSGDLIKRYRNNSFWIKDINPILTTQFPIFLEDYERITEKLENYLKFDFNKIKEDRDLSVHYDKNPMLIYNMVISLDLDDKLDLIIKFMDILDEMYNLTELVGNALAKDLESSHKEYQKKLNNS